MEMTKEDLENWRHGLIKENKCHALIITVGENPGKKKQLNIYFAVKVTLLNVTYSMYMRTFSQLLLLLK